MKNRAYIDIDKLKTVSKCLNQLVNAEQAQVDIEMQLMRPNPDAVWKKKAEAALRAVKAKRRLITARLAILRQEEKERNILLHQLHNDYLVDELKKLVTPSSFEHCMRRAAAKMESNNE